MAEIQLTKENFEKEVMQSDKPVLIDLWATWCGPCRMLAPIVEEVATEYADRIKVGKINVDEEPELAAAFKVTSIPMLVVIKDGRVVNQAIGYRPKEDVVSLLP